MRCYHLTVFGTMLKVAWIHPRVFCNEVPDAVHITLSHCIQVVLSLYLCMQTLSVPRMHILETSLKRQIPHGHISPYYAHSATSSPQQHLLTYHNRRNHPVAEAAASTVPTQRTSLSRFVIVHVYTSASGPLYVHVAVQNLIYLQLHPIRNRPPGLDSTSAKVESRHP